jgi:hypothetical protein
MDLSVVRDVHAAISLAHRFVYFVPEAAEEYAALGFSGRGSYFAARSAPMGAVSDEMIIATFYNFAPRSIRSSTAGAWDAASPAAWQEARFRAVRRALDRVGAAPSTGMITEARMLVDPVVSALDLAGMPLAAANVAVELPDDPAVALWQQITVVREWRGDAHIAVLVANQIDPCECTVLQVGTGRFPSGVARATRQWNEEEWNAAVGRLTTRGWMDASGAMTPAGVAAREHIEAETDRLCAPIWEPIGAAGAARLRELIAPIHAAFDAAGTYAALV